MEKLILEIKDLNVYYGKKQVLQNIDLSFPKNKITAIIGASGCGKSTFLKSLNRTIEEYGGNIEGKIFLDDVNVMEVPLQKLRGAIGMTFAPVYYGEKNKENLQEIVIKNLKKSGLYDEVKDDLNMLATKLSGGQQQRLAIARCLTVNPDIILLDEPCSALDIKNTAHIEKMLLDLKDEYTIIIVTHNLAQV